MENQKLALQIKRLIAIDELGKAIALLSENFQNNPIVDEIVLQSGRYHSLLRDQRKGVVEYAEVQQGFNQLRAGILEFLKTIDISKKESRQNAAAKLRLSLARLSVLWILKKENDRPDGLTVTEIFQRSKIKSRKNIYAAVAEMNESDLIVKTETGNRSYWKLSGKGVKLAEEFAETFLFNPEENK